jgi:hypothetical protein
MAAASFVVGDGQSFGLLWREFFLKDLNLLFLNGPVYLSSVIRETGSQADIHIVR